MNYTATFTKLDNGFMGQLIEWPEVITEADTMAECREMLKDALSEMILAYKQLGKSIPFRQTYLEPLVMESEYVG